jgi:hypothetical protein
MLTKTCSFDAPRRAALGGLSHVLKLVNPATDFAQFFPIFRESYLTFPSLALYMPHSQRVPA